MSRSSARLDMALLPCGMARLETSPFAADLVQFVSVAPSRSLARSGPLSPVLDTAKPSFAFPSRSATRLGLASPSLGMARLCPPLAVVDFVAMGSTKSLRSFAHLGPGLQASDCSHVGAPSSSVSHADRVVGARSGPHPRGQLDVAAERWTPRITPLSLVGVARVGSSLSVADFVRFSSVDPLRSPACVGTSLVVLDNSHVGAPSFLWSMACFGPALSSSGMARRKIQIECRFIFNDMALIVDG